MERFYWILVYVCEWEWDGDQSVRDAFSILCTCAIPGLCECVPWGWNFNFGGCLLRSCLFSFFNLSLDFILELGELWREAGINWLDWRIFLVKMWLHYYKNLCFHWLVFSFYLN